MGKLKLLKSFLCIIEGATKHFPENLATRNDRKGLTIEAAQIIINNSKIVLYQPNKQALKFLADNGYVVLNMKKKIVTAVPEKLRKKYKEYLEGKRDGQKS